MLIRPSRPPNGAVRIIPGPPATIRNTDPIETASSDHSPSRPMWLQRAIPPTATRETRDFSTSRIVSSSAARCPNAPPPSITTEVALSEITRGRSAGR